MRKNILAAIAMVIFLSLVSPEAKELKTFQGASEGAHDCKCKEPCKKFTKADFKGCYSYTFQGPFGREGSFASNGGVCDLPTTNDILELGISYANGKGHLIAHGNNSITGSSSSSLPEAQDNSTIWNCTYTVNEKGKTDILCDLYLNGTTTPFATNLQLIMNLSRNQHALQFVYLSDSSRASDDLLREAQILGHAIKQS